MLKHKKSPVEGRGNLMFSQRNNPYCDLLQISTAKVREKNENSKLYSFFYIFVQKNETLQRNYLINIVKLITLVR